MEFLRRVYWELLIFLGAVPTIRVAAANSSLYQFHRFLFMAYGGFALICALILAHYIVVSNDEGGTFGFAGMPFALLAVVHHYAAIGARDGKDWGRKLSIIIATIMLFGIPIGTVLGIWVFTQTGDKWKGEGGMLPMEKKS